MATREALLCLIGEFSIPQKDLTTHGRIDTPTKNELFWGYDMFGRIFINVPFCVRSHVDPSVMTDEALVIYQAYKDRIDLFSVSNNLPPVTSQMFLGTRLDDFSKLEALLTGRMVNIYGIGRWITSHYEEDTGRWAELRLKSALTRKSNWAADTDMPPAPSAVKDPLSDVIRQLQHA